MKFIDGRAIANRIKDNIAIETHNISKDGGPRPSLGIIIVGDRVDSKLYVKLKQVEAVKLGIDTNLYELPADASEEEILTVIRFLNEDSGIDAILVQLPLPESINTDLIISAINPKKDADGFHPQHPNYIISPVLGAVKEMISEIGLDLKNKKATVLYNSEIFGDEAKKLLSSLGLAQVDGRSLKHFKDLSEVECRLKLEEIKRITITADILVVAIGLPKFITADLVKEQAVVIDIGTNRVDDKVVGDVDSDSVKNKVSYLSPVPGGVGPLTVSLLLKNVLEIYKRK